MKWLAFTQLPHSIRMPGLTKRILSSPRPPPVRHCRTPQRPGGGTQRSSMYWLHMGKGKPEQKLTHTAPNQLHNPTWPQIVNSAYRGSAGPPEVGKEWQSVWTLKSKTRSRFLEEASLDPKGANTEFSSGKQLGKSYLAPKGALVTSEKMAFSYWINLPI